LQSSGASGAVRLRDTSAFVVSDNVIIEASPHAIVLAQTNLGVVVTNNTAVDQWSNVSSSASVIYVQAQYNTGIVANNLHRNAGHKSAATYKNERGLN